MLSTYAPLYCPPPLPLTDSLSDAYLNELRSEALAMLQPPRRPGGAAADPIVLAYHLDFFTDDRSALATRAELEYKRAHEGLCVIPVRGEGAAALAPLRALVEATSAPRRFSQAFHGRRILAFEEPYAAALPRSGFEESALTLCALAYAPSLPTTATAVDASSKFRVAMASFLRVRNDYNARLKGRACERAGRYELPPGERPIRPRQTLPLPDGGTICIAFSMADFASAAADLSAERSWDALLVADSCVPKLLEHRRTSVSGFHTRCAWLCYNPLMSAADVKEAASSHKRESRVAVNDFGRAEARAQGRSTPVFRPGMPLDRLNTGLGPLLRKVGSNVPQPPSTPTG